MSISSGPEIPGFEFLQEIGSGGFSSVYLYQQKLPRRRVALKVLNAAALDKASRRQFVAEANLMAQVSNHPAIATIYAADIAADGRPHFIMEHCSGGSLGTRYRTSPHPVDEVLRVGVRIASALESAHRVGIVHRDVKPANILITEYGSPVLTDFGISVGEDGAIESTLLRNDMTVATVNGGSSTQGLSIPWAPPEAFDDIPVSDARSDVFSLAATLFTLLEGRSPYEVPGASNSAVQLIRRIIAGEIHPPARADIPASLSAVLHGGMAMDPAHRPATALDFAVALQAVQSELGLAQTPIELPDSVAEQREPDLEETRVRPVVAEDTRPSAARPDPAAAVASADRDDVDGAVVSTDQGDAASIGVAAGAAAAGAAAIEATSMPSGAAHTVRVAARATSAASGPGPSATAEGERPKKKRRRALTAIVATAAALVVLTPIALAILPWPTPTITGPEPTPTITKPQRTIPTTTKPDPIPGTTASEPTPTITGPVPIPTVIGLIQCNAASDCAYIQVPLSTRCGAPERPSKCAYIQVHLSNSFSGNKTVCMWEAQGAGWMPWQYSPDPTNACASFLFREGVGDTSFYQPLSVTGTEILVWVTGYPNYHGTIW